MEDHVEIPEESMRHIEALLARHPPAMIQRMFSQALESRALRTPSFRRMANVRQAVTRYHLLRPQTPLLRAQPRRLAHHGGPDYRLHRRFQAPLAAVMLLPLHLQPRRDSG